MNSIAKISLRRRVGLFFTVLVLMSLLTSSLYFLKDRNSNREMIVIAERNSILLQRIAFDAQKAYYMPSGNSKPAMLELRRLKMPWK